MAKLGKNEDVRLEILVKICAVLDCKIDDIVEYGIETKDQVKWWKFINYFYVADCNLTHTHKSECSYILDALNIYWINLNEKSNPPAMLGRME